MQVLLPAMIFGVAIAILEMRIVFSIPWLRRAVTSHPVGGIVMSFVFAGMLNMVIGVAAVTVMFGTVMAIVLTGIVYRTDRFVKAYRERR